MNQRSWQRLKSLDCHNLSGRVTARLNDPPKPDAAAPPPIMMAPLSPSVVVPELKVMTTLAPDVVPAFGDDTVTLPVSPAAAVVPR